MEDVISNANINKNRYHSENQDFFQHTLDSFTLKDTIDFFAYLGIPIVTLDGGKMFPMSLQASSVLDILRFALEEKNIPVYKQNLEITKTMFLISPLIMYIWCDKLVCQV
jgi:predicted flavoprotein YhiN